MKTSRNSLIVLMSVIMLCGASTLQAQSRGRVNANENNNKSGNPGRGHDTVNDPGRDHNNEYKSQGHAKDFNSDSDRSQRNDHYRDISDNNRGKGNDRYNDLDRNKNNWNRDYPSRNVHRYNNYDSRHRYVTYNYHRHSHPAWAPAYGYRYNTRYIYYQDYNVYYDCHRDVFVIWTGRNWVMSNRIPDVMYRVDFGRARVSGVDYWDDDFDFYLQRRRPAYLTISAGW
jgi:hypothetical protein